MKGFKKRSDIYCGSYKIFSSGPKRLLETQTFKKKDNLSSEKILANFFSHYRVCRT